jgi:ketosteroid isomerase-like protein
MSRSNHDIAREFFAALSSGALPDELLAPDMTVWTTSSGMAGDKARYQMGIKLLASVTLDGRGLTYVVDTLTAEDDRVAAEVHSHGTLVNGEAFQMTYAFVLRIRDGRIASVAEHFNPLITNEKLGPLIAAALRKSAE